jgi:hypothetical protein
MHGGTVVRPEEKKIAAKVLLDAAAYLEKWGWVKGYLGGKYGNPTVAYNDGPACAMGAIHSVTSMALPWETPIEIYDAACDASDLAREALSEVIPTKVIPEWNDAPERTQEEVINTMRATAEKLNASK